MTSASTSPSSAEVHGAGLHRSGPHRAGPPGAEPHGGGLHRSGPRAAGPHIVGSDAAPPIAGLPEPGVARRAGHGRFTVERAGGRSVVRRAYATSPLRLLTPKNHGHAAWIYTSSYGGGLVDGDDIAIEASVGRGAAAFLSTQSATKVYRSPRGTRVALDAEVGEGALLVVAPDAVICFGGSRYRQTQRIAVAAGGGLVLVDWVTSGRRESGERWAFEEYVSRTVIHQAGRLVVHDAVALRVSDGSLAARFGRYDVLAVAVLLGRGLEGEIERLAARVRAEPVERRAGRLVAFSQVEPGGGVLRIAGRTVEDVDDVLRDLLGFVPRLLGDSPWARKW